LRGCVHGDAHRLFVSTVRREFARDAFAGEFL
jgi:hypothetical protein